MTKQASLRVKGGMFLTYPQFERYDMGKPHSSLEDIKAKILGQLSGYVREGKVESYDRGIIAFEQHEDGNWHLHMYIHAKLREQTEVRIKHCDLDLDGHHGNYQAARSDEKVSKYCLKDGDYIFWGVDPATIADLRGKKRSFSLAPLINGTQSLDEMVLQCPHLLLKYDVLQKNLSMYQASKKRRPAGTAPRFVYLTGPSGVGKTTVAKSLVPEEETFLVPLPQTKGVWWFDGYTGQRCLVFDNVSRETCPPYDLICQMVDTSPCRVPVKGGHVICSPDVIVVTSTVHPSQLWTTAWDVQVKRRLTDLWVASTISSRTMSENQEAITELEHGVDRTSVVWTQVDLTPWRVTALPTGTTTLLASLRATVSTCLTSALISSSAAQCPPLVASVSMSAPCVDSSSMIAPVSLTQMTTTSMQPPAQQTPPLLFSPSSPEVIDLDSLYNSTK